MICPDKKKEMFRHYSRERFMDNETYPNKKLHIDGPIYQGISEVICVTYQMIENRSTRCVFLAMYSCDFY